MVDPSKNKVNMAPTYIEGDCKGEKCKIQQKIKNLENKVYSPEPSVEDDMLGKGKFYNTPGSGSYNYVPESDTGDLKYKSKYSEKPLYPLATIDIFLNQQFIFSRLEDKIASPVSRISISGFSKEKSTLKPFMLPSFGEMISSRDSDARPVFGFLCSLLNWESGESVASLQFLLMNEKPYQVFKKEKETKTYGMVSSGLETNGDYSAFGFKIYYPQIIEKKGWMFGAGFSIAQSPDAHKTEEWKNVPKYKDGVYLGKKRVSKFSQNNYTRFDITGKVSRFVYNSSIFGIEWSTPVSIAFAFIDDSTYLQPTIGQEVRFFSRKIFPDTIELFLSAGVYAVVNTPGSTSKTEDFENHGIIKTGPDIGHFRFDVMLGLSVYR